MHPYRSHHCAQLTAADAGATVRLSGWVHRVRDHGGVLFIDLRDHYGITQVLADPDSPVFAEVEKLRSEWVIRIDGEVKAARPRAGEPEDPHRRGRGLHPRSGGSGPGRGIAAAGVRRKEYPEETRLKYRFLDLRREHLHANIMLRSA
jgi:aspartyl-tRNA synthetase